MDEGGTSWWLDTLRPTLLQALLDMTVQLRNVTVCCQAGGVTASVAFSALDAATALDPDAARRHVRAAPGPLPIRPVLGQFCMHTVVSTEQVQAGDFEIQTIFHYAGLCANKHSG